MAHHIPKLDRHGRTRSERIEACFDLFDRGFTNADVCRVAHIAPNTATKYRRMWEEQKEREIADKPLLLQDILGNTFTALRENEQVRRAAWDEFRKAESVVVLKCPSCEHEWKEAFANATTRNALLQTVLKSQEHRHKLFGVLGVKQEFFAMVAAVKAVQDLLITFMERELCDEDRHKLDAYLASPDLAPYMNQGAATMIEVASEIGHTEELEVASEGQSHPSRSRRRAS